MQAGLKSLFRVGLGPGPTPDLLLGKLEYRAMTSIARRALRAGRRSATIRGAVVPYLFRRSRDEAPPVLMVHGFGGDKESWLVFASFLRRTRGLVLPDLPGFGAASSIAKERASACEQAAVLADLLDAVGAPRAHLVGSSMGGGISLRFAADYPERTASLTLIGSVGPAVEKSEVGLAFDRGENPLLIESADDLERLLGLVAERLPPAPRAMRRYLGADRFARREAQEALFDGWVACPPEHGVPDGDDLLKVHVPALVIHGEKDRVIHPATGRALADRLPDGRLEMMPGIGHVPQIEAPKKTADSVERFYASIARG
jgi:pimeloyl-ACP methyl ester carboxylesterase